MLGEPQGAANAGVGQNICTKRESQPGERRDKNQRGWCWGGVWNSNNYLFLNPYYAVTL